MNRTTFAYALACCGLSRAEAAEYLQVSQASIEDWCKPRITKYGPASPPTGVWDKLAVLYRRIEAAADHAAGMLEPGLMDRLMMNNVAADDAEDPLPGGADLAAGAMALLLAIGMDQDEREDAALANDEHADAD